MESEYRLITPELTSALFGEKHHNRKVKEDVVVRYAEDMRSGRWFACGDSIKISKSGVLLDGQHRLLAIIKSGIPIYCTVVKDVDDRAMDVIDTGCSRTAGDVYSLNSIKYGQQLSGAIATFFKIKSKDGGMNTAQFPQYKLLISIAKTKKCVMMRYASAQMYMRKETSQYHTPSLVPYTFI